MGGFYMALFYPHSLRVLRGEHRGRHPGSDWRTAGCGRCRYQWRHLPYGQPRREILELLDEGWDHRNSMKKNRRHVKLPEGHRLLMGSKCRFLLFERPFVCLWLWSRPQLTADLFTHQCNMMGYGYFSWVIWVYPQKHKQHRRGSFSEEKEVINHGILCCPVFRQNKAKQN